MASTISNLADYVSRSSVSASNTSPIPSANETQLAKKIDVAKETSVFEEAAKVQTSVADIAKKQGTQRALRQLSDASSFVSIGQDAVGDIKRLVDAAKSVADKLTTEVDSGKRAKLADEASSYLSQIDEVKSNAKFGEVTVIDRGQQTFEVSLDGFQTDSASKSIISVADIRVSRSDLGLSSADAAAFEQIRDSEDQTISALENAQDQLVISRQSLRDSERDIASAAEQFGVQAERDANGGKSKLDLEAQELASQLAKSIKDSLGSGPQALDPQRVLNLLADPEEAEASSENPDAAAPTPPAREDNDDEENTVPRPAKVSFGGLRTS